MSGWFARDQLTRQRGGRHRHRLRKPAPRPLADPGPDEVAMRRREADLTELDRLIATTRKRRAGCSPDETREVPVAGNSSGPPHDCPDPSQCTACRQHTHDGCGDKGGHPKHCKCGCH